MRVLLKGCSVRTETRSLTFSHLAYCRGRGSFANITEVSPREACALSRVPLTPGDGVFLMVRGAPVGGEFLVIASLYVPMPSVGEGHGASGAPHSLMKAILLCTVRVPLSPNWMQHLLGRNWKCLLGSAHFCF